MINSSQLYYALLCMRNSNDRFSFDPCRDTIASDILKDNTEARVINTFDLSYDSLMLPEYYQDYAINITPKDDPSPYLLFSGTAQAKADIVKENTNLDYIYGSDSDWVKQLDLYNCYFTRNNLLRYLAIYSHEVPIEPSLGVIEYESTRTRVSTTYNTQDGYVSETSTIEYSGTLSDMSGGLNRALPSISKTIVYNIFLDEFYISEDIELVVKLKLILNDASALGFLDSYKFVYNELQEFDFVDSIIYDTDVIELNNNAFVTVTARDFDPPLDKQARYSRSLDGNRVVYTYKEFNTYQELINLVMN